MLLSIVIVSYNTAKLTVQAVQSAIADIQQSGLLKSQSEVIVIDNNSADESVAILKNLAKTSPIPLMVITRKTNDGFAVANNDGIRRAKGHYVLLLNSDTIVHAHSLERLVTAMEEHPVNDLTSTTRSQRGKLDRLGILAAALSNPDGTSQPQGGSFPTLTSLACHMLMLDDLPVIGQWLPSTQHTGKRTPSATAQDTLRQQDWVGGTAMLVRRQVIDEIGDLDEGIFMYGEDVEFCLRAQQHHWDVALHPAAEITHYGMASGSSAKALAGELAGYLYIWAKHKPHWQQPIARILIKLGILLRTLIFGTMNPEKARLYRQLIGQF